MAASSTIVPQIGKIIAWLVAIIVVLAMALVVFVLTFDWNRARRWVNDKVGQAIGRQFAITGDLKVNWRHPVGETGWRARVPWPRFSAANITVANPDWTRQPHFATLDEIDFEIAVLPLLTHDIVIPTINFTNPSVDLERLRDGRTNWNFKPLASMGTSQWKLDLHDIAFARGKIALFDQQNKVDAQMIIDTLGQPIPIGDAMKQQEKASRRSSAEVAGKQGASKLTAQAKAAAASESAAAPSIDTSASTASGAIASGGKPPPLYSRGWTVKGTYSRTPVSGSGKVGGALALQDASRLFPVQADLKAGDLHVALVGTITDPAHLAAVDLRLWLQGNSMAHLYSLTGMTLPDTPPYTTEGRLVGQFRQSGNVFRYENFTGRVGGSDLNGSLTYTAREPRPLLQGELVSNLLQFVDLAPVIGADSKASKARCGDATAQPSSKALPVEEFRTDRWKAIDADVNFIGRRIVRNPNLPITDLNTHVVMTDGVLSLVPLSFGVAGGTLASNFHLDGSTTPLKGRFATSVRHLKLKQLFGAIKFEVQHLPRVRCAHAKNKNVSTASA